MNDARRNLALQIARRRASKGLLLSELAKEAALPYPLLKRLEDGAADPSLHTVAKLAVALDCNAAQLLEPVAQAKIWTVPTMGGTP